jgi:hypothetical protein
LTETATFTAGAAQGCCSLAAGALRADAAAVPSSCRCKLAALSAALRFYMAACLSKGTTKKADAFGLFVYPNFKPRFQFKFWHVPDCAIVEKK